jgi:hypothetical protein
MAMYALDVLANVPIVATKPYIPIYLLRANGFFEDLKYSLKLAEPSRVNRR